MNNLFSILRNVFTAKRTLFTTAVGTGGYVTYTDVRRYPKMVDAFEHGSILVPFKTDEYKTIYHNRPRLEAKLKYILGPEFTNEYYLVIGEIGTGKSRSIRKVVKEMIEDSEKHGNGAPIYVSVSQLKDFNDSLGKAVGFKFDEHINFKFYMQYVMNIDRFPQRGDQRKLNRVLFAIETAAYQYLLKHGRPAVIVLDGVESLNKTTTGMKGALEKIQEKAKLWADSNICKVVFVSNDVMTETILKANKSCWTRASAPVIVDDVTKEEALDYLQKESFIEGCPTHKSMDREHAEKIYNLVGGRMQDLTICKRDYVRGEHFEVTSQMLKEREREKFLMTWSPDLWKTVEAVMNSPEMAMSVTSLSAVTGNNSSVEFLQEENILKLVRGSSGLVWKFESKLTENTIRDMYLEQKIGKNGHVKGKP